MSPFASRGAYAASIAVVVVFAVYRHYEVAARWDKLSFELRPALAHDGDVLPEVQPVSDSDTCPRAGLKASAGCHIDEVARCSCTRREGSSVTVCKWICEPKP